MHISKGLMQMYLSVGLVILVSRCSGFNWDTNNPKETVGGTSTQAVDYIRLAMGNGGHTCAVSPVGRLRCWGSNAFGQLGLSSTTNIGDDEALTSVPDVQIFSPAEFAAGAKVQKAALGLNHTCVLTSLNSVRCFGDNANGLLGLNNGGLGIGDDEHPYVAGDVQILTAAENSANVKILDIAASTGHTCVRLSNDVCRCWGDGTNGRLGDGQTAAIGDDELPNTGSGAPHGVASPVGLALGAVHSCILGSTGNVRCWGSGVAGRLGYGTLTFAIGNGNAMIGDVPAELPYVDLNLGESITAIASNGTSSCALTASGRVRCFGANAQGQLGIGSTATVGDDETASTSAFDALITSTAEYAGGLRPLTISVGTSHACALMNNGYARCWGAGSNGRLGYGLSLFGTNTNLGDEAAGVDTQLQVDIPTPEKLVSVRAGGTHTCAVSVTNKIYCWGANASGRLGYGNTATVPNIGDNVYGSIINLPALDIGF